MAVVLFMVPQETAFSVEFYLYRLHKISNIGHKLIFGGISGLVHSRAFIRGGSYSEFYGILQLRTSVKLPMSVPESKLFKMISFK